MNPNLRERGRVGSNQSWRPLKPRHQKLRQHEYETSNQIVEYHNYIHSTARSIIAGTQKTVTIHMFASWCLVPKASIYYLDSPVAISPSFLLPLSLLCLVASLNATTCWFDILVPERNSRCVTRTSSMLYVPSYIVMHLSAGSQLSENIMTSNNLQR